MHEKLQIVVATYYKVVYYYYIETKHTGKQMTTINQSVTESGATMYEFTSRGTDYTIITNDNHCFEVWSSRKSLGPQVGSVNLYYGLKELAARSKALSNLAKLIQA